MGKALYRKHRPKKLDDIIGQEHITTTLAKAIKSGRVSHAYLLTGPRGTGKTSIARILAHEVNGLPYEDESIHLDIIEIDAASNRRIDEIRELKDRVNIAPTSAKYKVYIIDEVHMLTREAFNALLKTLEEPPEHAIFVLATTEAHKLPETIVSRTQRFSLKPIDLHKVAEHLKQIAKEEKLTIDGDALELIAQHGNGSFRDSISLLDQVGNSSDHVTRSDVQQALGHAPKELINSLIDASIGLDSQAMAAGLGQAVEQGVQPAQLSEQLSAEIRRRLLENQLGEHSRMFLNLTKELLSVPFARNPQAALELALYGAIIADTASSTTHSASAPKIKATDTSTQRTTTRVVKTSGDDVSLPSKKPIEPAKADDKESKNPPEEVAQKPVATTAVRIATDASDTTDAPTEGDWKDILDAVKAKHNTLYGIARMATPEFSPGNITLVFGFPFHHKRVSDAKNHQILSAIAQDVTGHKLMMTYRLDKQSTKPAAQTSEKPKPPVDLSSITEIFGDAEVLD